MLCTLKFHCSNSHISHTHLVHFTLNYRAQATKLPIICVNRFTEVALLRSVHLYMPMYTNALIQMHWSKCTDSNAMYPNALPCSVQAMEQELLRRWNCACLGVPIKLRNLEQHSFNSLPAEKEKRRVHCSLYFSTKLVCSRLFCGDLTFALHIWGGVFLRILTGFKF